MIEEIMKDEAKITDVHTKRSLSSHKKKSFGEASLELAKLHVSYISKDEFIYNNNINHLKLYWLMWYNWK